MGRPKQFDPDVAVDRAVEVFWAKGFGATTPQDLVEAIGIGKGSLYNAFGSKHELFNRALGRYADEQAAALVAFLATPGPVRPLLRAALRQIIAMNVGASGARGCLAVNTAAELGQSDAEAVAHVQRMFDRTEAAFEAAVIAGQSSGELSCGGDPKAIASLLLIAVVGVQVMVKSSLDTDRMYRAADALVAAI